MKTITNDDGVMMMGTVLQPAKHGFVIDVSVGTRRTQVRVFEFEEQPFQGGMCEMPKALTMAEGIARLRGAMELMRECAFAAKVDDDEEVRS